MSTEAETTAATTTEAAAAETVPVSPVPDTDTAPAPAPAPVPKKEEEEEKDEEKKQQQQQQQHSEAPPLFDHEKKKAELEEKLQKMFSSLGGYMQAELDMTTDDFKMLQELNMAALHKYETMTQNAGNLATYLESIQANCKQQ